MALVRFGNSGPVFGLVQETTGYAQDASVKTANEKATIEDEVGQTVTVGYFNTLYSGTITIVDKAAATLPVMLTALVLANVTECAKVVIYEKERKPEQKGYQKNTFTFEAYASISY